MQLRHRKQRAAIVSVVLTAGISVGLLTSTIASPSSSVEVATKTLVVQSGDTWLSIATRLAPGASPDQLATYAAQLATENGANAGNAPQVGRFVLYAPSELPAAAPTSTTTPTTAAPTTVKPPVDGGPTTTTAPSTTIKPVAHFSTLPPGAALPTEAQCAAMVRPTPEVKPNNTKQNHTIGTPSPQTPRVTGNFTGTTDEIIQWAACKWGIDEDIVRAQAQTESGWNQDAAGDRTPNTNPANCGAGQVITNGSCPESIGIMQVRTRYYSEYDRMSPWTSTAYNIDLTEADMRRCYNGEIIYPTYLKPHGYAAGDLYGCLGFWFSGDWHDAGANQYLVVLKAHYANRDWPKP
jgi:autotransporter family porin